MIYVDTMFKIDSVKEKIVNSPVMGVDIETYDYKNRDFGTIRLVQIAVEDEVFVFDLQKVTLPDYLKTVFSDREKTKIFHYGFFDMSHLIKEYGCEFVNTFCTLNAVKVLTCGLNVKYSLKETAKTFLGIEMDKTEQTSDWGGELSQSQIAYASKDAHVLVRLYRVLKDYLKKKRLLKISKLENALQIIDAENFAKRIFPDKKRVDEISKSIERDYFRGISLEEIKKGKKIPQSLKEKIEQYETCKAVEEKGFFPQFKTNWKSNGYFFQKNYNPFLRKCFSKVLTVKFKHIFLPSLHANARDFKSKEFYSNPDFFESKEFYLLKAVALEHSGLIEKYSHLIEDFKKEIPGILKWHNEIYRKFAEKKPVRVAGGKIIHTKNFVPEKGKSLPSFVVEGTVSDFFKSIVVLTEKAGGKVLQFDAENSVLEFTETDKETVENAISQSAELFFGEKIPSHFYEFL